MAMMNTVLKPWKTAHYSSLCLVKASPRLCSTSSPSKQHAKSQGDDDPQMKKRDVGERSEELTGRGKEALREGLDITQQEFQEMNQKFEEMKERAQDLKQRASDD